MTFQFICPSCKAISLINTHLGKQIVREHFDELYPDIPVNEKRNIIMIPRLSFKNNTEILNIELSYLGEEGMSVTVSIDTSTGEILDFTPWNFSALINDYKTSISRSDVIEIALPLYQTALEQAKENYPKEAQLFIKKYGSDALELDQMYFETIFVSPYGVGSSDECAYWQVFVAHQLDIDPISHFNYGDGWFYLKIHAKTGEVLESRSNNFFFSDTRLSD